MKTDTQTGAIETVRFQGINSWAVLHLGDCLDMLPIEADAVITDPPYGIGAARNTRANQQHGKAAAPSRDYGFSTWDDAPADAARINAILSLGIPTVIWGGNYFHLPPMPGWLFWDKDNGNNGYADGELAWTNLEMALRKKRFRWSGMLQENMADKEERIHPTQKPVAVMAWCMEVAKIPAGALVADLFMGSGTTGIACLRTGRNFVGIERDEKHFKTACERFVREVDGQLL